ncbi:Fic/DOC family protein [Pedobacter deserti]|uniref:Fic/DOC family protein n=1 Tax=Pedobacter deserti TaxID=2817382 RepID=UPI00210D408C|nr:Fic family protein [Pedobacter sp. SYSU D00382]
MKYDLPDDQGEILPNILNLKTSDEISLAEFEGFLKAEIILTEQLTLKTKFSLKYILQIHKLSLEHLYSFAGKLREVNISKGGFPFPAAKYLAQSMLSFENELLSKLPSKHTSKEDLIKSIAEIHGELLFIHPFREGNGRTARILANLMARKQGYDSLLFEKINKTNFSIYVTAIQKSAEKDYQPMIDFITSIFPD